MFYGNILSELYKNLSLVMPKEDAEFIMDIIKEHKDDSYLLYMENDAYKRMEERGIEKQFNDVCNKLKIQWTHYNGSLDEKGYNEQY